MSSYANVSFRLNSKRALLTADLESHILQSALSVVGVIIASPFVSLSLFVLKLNVEGERVTDLFSNSPEVFVL